MHLLKAASGACAILAAASAQAAAPPAGSQYVAMGSSYAAGPGITASADTPADRCRRSRDNYAHQLARKHGLTLVDVSCSGATTAHLFAPWNELAAQLDAVTPDTRLVTVTIGGNDVRSTARIGALYCRTAMAEGRGPASCQPLPAEATPQEWSDLELHMTQIAQEVRKRAPAAQLVFVDYTTLLPPQGTCAALALTPAQAAEMRALNNRVVEVTARAARATGSGLLTSSALTAAHDVCSSSPWANGYAVPTPPDGVPFHPRLAAHTAIAEALGKLIWP